MAQQEEGALVALTEDYLIPIETYKEVVYTCSSWWVGGVVSMPIIYITLNAIQAQNLGSQYRIKSDGGGGGGGYDGDKTEGGK